MTDIPKLTTPKPSRRGQTQEQFDAYAEALFDWMVSLPGPIEAIVSEVLALIDMRNYNPGTTYNQTGYTRPSAVYGSDGLTYVCIGANVIGDNPVGSVTGNWKKAPYGYTPVQQGGGVGQLANAVKIGWSAASKLKATVDSTDLGYLITEAMLPALLNAHMPGSGGASGYQKFKNGITIQWGADAYPGGSVTDSVVFPIAFASTYVVVLQDNLNAVQRLSGTPSPTGFSYIGGAGGAQTMYWIAIGYITPA